MCAGRSLKRSLPSPTVHCKGSFDTFWSPEIRDWTWGRDPEQESYSFCAIHVLVSLGPKMFILPTGWCWRGFHCQVIVLLFVVNMHLGVRYLGTVQMY